MAGRDVAWRWFFVWATVGACLALGDSQVGLLTVPVGVLLALFLALKRRFGIALVGLIEGVAVVCAVVGALNLNSTPCPPSGSVGLLPGQESVSCGGFDGAPWLIAGV